MPLFIWHNFRMLHFKNSSQKKMNTIFYCCYCCPLFLCVKYDLTDCHTEIFTKNSCSVALYSLFFFDNNSCWFRCLKIWNSKKDEREKQTMEKQQQKFHFYYDSLSKESHCLRWCIWLLLKCEQKKQEKQHLMHHTIHNMPDCLNNLQKKKKLHIFESCGLVVAVFQTSNSN